MVDKVIVRYMGSLWSSVNSQLGFRQDCKVRNEQEKRNRLRWVARSSHLAGAPSEFLSSRQSLEQFIILVIVLYLSLAQFDSCLWKSYVEACGVMLSQV